MYISSKTFDNSLYPHHIFSLFSSAKVEKWKKYLSSSRKQFYQSHDHELYVIFITISSNIHAHKVISRFEYFRIIFESWSVLVKQRVVLSSESNFSSDGHLRCPIKNNIGLPPPNKRKSTFFVPRNRGKMRVSPYYSENDLSSLN